MKEIRFLADRGLPIRQAITAWGILFFSVIVFATLATLLSMWGIGKEQSIVVSLIIVGALAALTHVILYYTNYRGSLHAILRACLKLSQYAILRTGRKPHEEACLYENFSGAIGTSPLPRLTGRELGTFRSLLRLYRDKRFEEEERTLTMHFVVDLQQRLLDECHGEEERKWLSHYFFDWGFCEPTFRSYFLLRSSLTELNDFLGETVMRHWHAGERIRPLTLWDYTIGCQWRGKEANILVIFLDGVENLSKREYRVSVLGRMAGLDAIQISRILKARPCDIFEWHHVGLHQLQQDQELINALLSIASREGPEETDI